MNKLYSETITDNKIVMHLKKLTPDCEERELLDAINQESFPPSEYMPMDKIFDFAQKTNSDVLGIFADKQLVGFIVFLKNDDCGYVFFLAIDKNERSKGYGGTALEMLATTYSKLQIILDFEEIDEKAENIAQRIRRKNFYLSNGFCETGRYTFLGDDRFEVVCNNAPLRVDSFKELISVIHSHCPNFPNKLL